MTDLPDFELSVEFMPNPDVTLEQMSAIAAEVDDDPMGSYSYKQAIVVIFHQAPERLHEVLIGWSVVQPWTALA